MQRTNKYKAIDSNVKLFNTITMAIFDDFRAKKVHFG